MHIIYCKKVFNSSNVSRHMSPLIGLSRMDSVICLVYFKFIGKKCIYILMAQIVCQIEIPYGVYNSNRSIQIGSKYSYRHEYLILQTFPA